MFYNTVVLAARGESKRLEKSGTANQFASGEVLCFQSYDGGELAAVPIFRSRTIFATGC